MDPLKINKDMSTKEKILRTGFNMSLQQAQKSKGKFDATVDVAKNTYNDVKKLVTDPIGVLKETKDSLKNFASHPLATVKTIAGSVKDSFEKDVIHGNDYSRAYWGTKATINTATAVVGTKGVGSLTKIGKNSTGVTSGKSTSSSSSSNSNKGTGKFDPLSNPKIAKEIESNSDAVYGYSPKKGSPLDKFGVDWTNQERVASARAKRMEYLKNMEQKKVKLESEVAKLQSEGMSIEEIARKMSEKRNLDRMKSYDSSNSEGLAAMKERNIQQYGREEGPTPEQLFEKYGSWEEVIYGSVRTSPAMDVLTGLYKE